MSPLNSRPSSSASRQTEPSVWPGVCSTPQADLAEPDLAALGQLHGRDRRRDLERGDRAARAGGAGGASAGWTAMSAPVCAATAAFVADVVPVAVRADDQPQGPRALGQRARDPLEARRSRCRSRSPRAIARPRGRRRWSTSGPTTACRRSMAADLRTPARGGDGAGHSGSGISAGGGAECGLEVAAMTTTMRIKARITPWDDREFVQAFEHARDTVQAEDTPTGRAPAPGSSGCCARRATRRARRRDPDRGREARAHVPLAGQPGRLPGR